MLRQYYWQRLKWVGGKHWAWPSAISTVVGIAIAALTWCNHNWVRDHISDSMSAFVSGTIPILAGLSIFIVRWLISPFIVYRDVTDNVTGLESRLYDIEHRVRFDLKVSILDWNYTLNDTLKVTVVYTNNGTTQRSILDASFVFTPYGETPGNHIRYSEVAIADGNSPLAIQPGIPNPVFYSVPMQDTPIASLADSSDPNVSGAIIGVGLRIRILQNDGTERHKAIFFGRWYGISGVIQRGSFSREIVSLEDAVPIWMPI